MEIGVSDILSIAAILGSIYTYFRTKKKIDDQQMVINQYTIDKNKKEKEESLQANLRAFRDKERKCLIIQNIGKAQLIIYVLNTTTLMIKMVLLYLILGNSHTLC